MNFQRYEWKKRIKSMLRVDLRRTFTTPLFYILVGSCFIMPLLILVMTTMMDGTVTVNPQTQVETVIEGFDHAWQIIGSLSGESAGMSMDLTSMCNINLVYFVAAVAVCLFIADDFRSGYAKNLFTVRAKKTDYVVSKTVVGFLVGCAMLLAFFIGSMLGGAICKLPFDVEGVKAGSIVCCLLAKLLLMAVFVAIYVTMSVVAKQKAWLSMLLSFGSGTFLFAMIPMVTPLNATLMHVVLCLAGGVLFAVGLGAISVLLLKKRDIL